MPSHRPTSFALASSLLAAAGAVALTVINAPGHAAPQDALGDGRGLEHRSGSGRALDSNSRHGSGGSNTPGVQEDLRARNLVVTGNVAGGRGFRGNVNYTADRDFRGSTSDDSSYDFRAGAAFSDPRLARAGSMGDRLDVARNYGTVEYGRSAVRGSLSGFDANSTRLMFDQASARLLTPEARRSMMDLATVSTVTSAEGKNIRVQTGGFRGVAATIDADAVDTMELGLYDTARLKQDLRDGKIDKELKSLNYQNPLMPDFVDPTKAKDGDPGAAPNAAGGTRLDASRIDTGVTSMDSILKQVERKIDLRAERDAGLPGAAPGEPDRGGDADSASAKKKARERILKDLDDLRRELRGDLPERPEEKEDGAPRPADAPKEDGAVGALGTDRGAGMGAGGAAAGPERVRDREKAFNEMIDLLRHGQPVENVSGNAVARVQEILQSAESAMSRQAYFLAEQHFNTALTLTPRNPMAKAGLVNAQLGAGLLSSAAITLRELYVSNPEVIDARMAASLLPPRDRMEALLEKLKSMPIDARNTGDAGLLTAYLGRQLGDPVTIEQGLDLLGKGSASDATLAKLLRGIWLGTPAPAAAPAGAAAPAAPPAAMDAPRPAATPSAPPGDRGGASKPVPIDPFP